MAISTRCPECNNRLRFDDDEAGERVECPDCGAEFRAPTASAPARPARSRLTDEDGEPERQSPRPKSRKPEPVSRRRDDDDDRDDEYEERPRRRRPVRRRRNNGTAFAVTLAVVLVVAAGLGVTLWLVTRDKTEPVKREVEVAGARPDPAPAPEPGVRSNNRGKIEGTKWSSIQAVVKGQNIPAGAIKLEFAANGGLMYQAGPMTYTGRYSLGAGDGVTLLLDQALAGRRTHIESVSVTGNRLTMTDADGTGLTFERAR